MAVDVSQGNENMDYTAHVQTYKAFIQLVKYGTAGIVLLLVLMAIFLLN